LASVFCIKSATVFLARRQILSEDLGVGGNIILEYILEILGGKLWA
jgi:hypothetical protein